MQQALVTTPQFPTYDNISDQNDLCRRALIDASVANIIPCRFIMTSAVGALPYEDRVAIMHAVSSYCDFAKSNDPYGEHDFGSFKHQDRTLFWKIDYYDRNYQFGSEDPADITKTNRVLTIMFANEY